MNPTDAHLAAEGEEVPQLRTTARLVAQQCHPGGDVATVVRQKIYSALFVRAFELACEQAADSKESEH